MIGDWQIKRCEPEEIRLVVNPGYGASKKMSYTQLDVSAVLSYTFVLRPTSTPQLFINGLKARTQLRPGGSPRGPKTVSNLRNQKAAVLFDIRFRIGFVPF